MRLGTISPKTMETAVTTTMVTVSAISLWYSTMKGSQRAIQAMMVSFSADSPKTPESSAAAVIPVCVAASSRLGLSLIASACAARPDARAGRRLR